jgi:tetratricopeptide (TPR) repeat protein
MATKHVIQEAEEAIQAGKFDEAANTLSGLVASQPGNSKARWLLLQCHERLNEIQPAIEHLVQLLKSEGRNLTRITQLGSYARHRGYPLKIVTDAFERFLEKTPGSAVATYNLAYYLGKDGQFEKAIPQFQRALDLGIRSPEEVHLNMANMYMDHFQDNEKARQHLETAISIKPGYVQAHFNLGNLAERVGNREEAQSCFEKCLELDPDNEFALARLGDAHKFSGAEDPMIGRLADRAPQSENPDLHFTLGRAYDQVGAFDDAWACFEKANELDRQVYPEYRQSRAEALFQRITARLNSDWLSGFGGESHQPVFICGMFRTGSTLLEQMLAAHPVFTAGGESEFFPRLVSRIFPAYPDGLEALRPESIETWKTAHAALCEQRAGVDSRMTDKRPDNFLYAGLIKAILPQAKFVVTERDWHDVAVSVFSNRLGPTQGYATRLQDIRHYLDLHRKLIDHWQELLGDDLIRISYEELVNSPRETIGGLLERLGEEWNEACLEFDKQQSTVGTASVWQVRQPLSPKSIGRWKNYEKHFKDAFGEE